MRGSVRDLEAVAMAHRGSDWQIRGSGRQRRLRLEASGRVRGPALLGGEHGLGDSQHVDKGNTPEGGDARHTDKQRTLARVDSELLAVRRRTREGSGMIPIAGGSTRKTEPSLGPDRGEVVDRLLRGNSMARRDEGDLDRRASPSGGPSQPISAGCACLPRPVLEAGLGIRNAGEPFKELLEVQCAVVYDAEAAGIVQRRGSGQVAVQLGAGFVTLSFVWVLKLSVCTSAEVV